MGDASNTVKCCLCREALEPSGWCGYCALWPINITPIRYCAAGHVILASGWCPSCHAYQATELLPEPGEWRDTGKTPDLLHKAAGQAQARAAAARIVGPGWPEREVPLREDCIPRRWRRERLRKVDTTPHGFQVVFPDRIEPQESADTEDVPF